MRIRYRVAIAVALLALISAGAWLVLFPREPSYNGKPLSYWLSEYGNTLGDSTPEDRERVTSALVHIGSNAMPELSKMLRARDSTFKLKVMELAGRQHLVKFRFVRAAELNYIAYNALRAMGDQAVLAVPVLAEVYAHDVAIFSNYPVRTNFTVVMSSNNKFRMIDSPEFMLNQIPALLARLGPAASNSVPALTLGLSCTNLQLRQDALIALRDIHSRPDVTVPALIKDLHDPHFGDRSLVWDIIQALGSDAAPALPIIFARLQDPDVQVQKAAMRVIYYLKVPADAAIAVPALTKVLSSTDSYQNYEALHALELYGPDAKPAVPAIFDLLHRRESALGRPDLSLRDEIRGALNHIDRAAAHAAGLE